MSIRLMVLSAALMAVVPAQADDIHVRTGLTFAGPLEALKSGFESATGDKLLTAAANAPADLMVLQQAQFDPLVKDGKVDKAALTDVARARVGFAVKAGAPVPDISTPEKLKAVLLAAKSVGLSSGASGVYVAEQVFPKLGIADQVKPKTVSANGPVGESVAKGAVEVGFQQMCELLPIKGITVVGRIPDALQTVTVITAGVPKDARSPEAARRFIAYMTSPAAAAVFKSMDLEPAK